MKDKMNFNTLGQAILLYYQNQNGLFTDQLISEKLTLSPEVIRKEIENRFHNSPEKLIAFLQPERIKKCITRTKKQMSKKGKSENHIHIELMNEFDLENLSISYHLTETSLGPIIMASTYKGVCYIAFADNGAETAIEELKKRFLKAVLKQQSDDFQKPIVDFFNDNVSEVSKIRLHIKGTLFQLGVWKKLLEIPLGGLMSYSALAGNKKDSHAFGNAVGSNPVAMVIPCHRAVSASGEFGEYHWGKSRKAALICLEAVKLSNK